MSRQDECLSKGRLSCACIDPIYVTCMQTPVQACPELGMNCGEFTASRVTFLAYESGDDLDHQR